MKKEKKPSTHGKLVSSSVRDTSAVSPGTKETTAPISITSARPAALPSCDARRACAATPSETNAITIVNQNAAVFAIGARMPKLPSKAAARPSGNPIAYATQRSEGLRTTQAGSVGYVVKSWKVVAPISGMLIHTSAHAQRPGTGGSASSTAITQQNRKSAQVEARSGRNRHTHRPTPR